MIEPFQAPRIKIDRARVHLDELTSEIERFFDRGAVQVVFERANEFAGLQGDTCSFTYREKEAVPLSWSAIVGDVIHNLRVSLDLLASDLHRITGGQPKDAPYVHYPFCKAQSELSDMIKSRRLNGVGRAFIDAIEQTAPYKGGNVGLRAIHDLDLLDKHQALVPVVAVVSLPWPVPIYEGPQNFTTTVVKDGQRLITMPRIFCPLPLGTVVKAEFSVLFGSDATFEGAPLVQQLDACVSGVEGVFSLFQSIASKNPSTSNVGTS